MTSFFDRVEKSRFEIYNNADRVYVNESLKDWALEMFETFFHEDRIDKEQSFARIILTQDILRFLECNEVFVQICR
jgi:hypothetical protein